MATQSFKNFSLRDELLTALDRKGFDAPLPVQVRLLEDETLIEGDLIVQARTGSGKTLAFALPLLNSMEKGNKTPKVLVLSPTRELAQQTAKEFQWVGADMAVRVVGLVGGMDMDRQIRALKEGVTVVVGTPGRVLDHLKRGTFKAEGIQSLVLDEGDHMLDMGFKDELESIFDALPAVERTWLFSATMPEDVVTLARKYLDAPRKISLVTDIARHEDIIQRAYIVPSRRRFEGLANVLLFEQPKRALLFCTTRLETQELSDKLCDEGFKAMALHGDMSQRERNTALEAFRRGRVDLLVATDVAARGLDIDGLSHVIQHGLPGCLETFVHRSGRTGRAGHEGKNIILLSARESKQFKHMLSKASTNVEWLVAPDAADVEGLSRAEFERSLLEPSEYADIYLEWTKEILQRDDMTELIAGMLERAYGDRPHGYSIRQEVEAEISREKQRKEPQSGSASGRKYGNADRAGRGQQTWKTDRPHKDNYQDRPPKREIGDSVDVQFPQGRKDGWEVGALLGAICRGLGVRREDVGNIRLRDACAIVELSIKAASLLDNKSDKMAKEGLSGGKQLIPHAAERKGRKPVFKGKKG